MTTTDAAQATRDFVLTATTATITDKDASAVDRYFAPDYKEHAQTAADGCDGLRAFIAELPGDFGYERVRVLAEDDLVVIHGIYHGFGPDPLVAFDIWRVADDKIVEHWDALTSWSADTASGRSQTDGAQETTRPEDTAAAKALVTEFVEKVLVRGDDSALSDYVAAEGFAQHNPEVADGIAGFRAAAAQWATEGKTQSYTKVHQVVAEGEFVFTRSEGFLGEPVAFNDLWRVSDGKIVEHWDVIEPISTEHAHNNGAF